METILNQSTISITIKAMGFSTNLLENHFEEIRTLIEDMQQDILSSDDVSEQLEIMTKREIILNRQKEYCGIWLASDGRYKTKVPTSDGGKKLIAKSTKEDLDNLIIKHYKNLENKPTKPCMRTIYPEWLEFKSKETSYANACNLQSRWNRYFENSTIVDVPFEKLTTGTIKKWCVDVIAEMHLTDRQFKDLKSIMNMIFDYAVSFDIIQINLSRQVRGFSDKNFKKKEVKPDNEIVYFDDVQSILQKKALNMYLKTRNTAYLAICINFTLGLRVGELVALRTSHINEDGSITICQEETKTYHKDADGTIHRDGYEIVDHTKTLSGNRRLPLTPRAQKYIKMVEDHNKSLELEDGDFLFLNNKTGKRMHDCSINTALRRLNGVTRKNTCSSKKTPNGNHSIRKTVISKLHDSMQFSDDTIKTFAGHKDISTTQKCYIHQVTDINNYATQFAKVLDS